MKKSIVLILFTVLSFSSCKKIIESASSVGKDNINVEDLKAVHVNNEYSLSVPDYMTELKSLHDEASFEYANIFKETYTVVLDESKQEFIDTFKEIEMYNDSISALDNYTNIQLQSFQENITDLKVKPLDNKIKNLDSKQYEFHGKVDDLEIAYLIGFIEGKDKMFMIMSWTMDNRYNKYKDTFKLIQGSFKFL
ncbi:hypothetical protein MC378_04590 [Polaribacter sp. MSW13]|uniref:Uncharacterized protein n=1 Tax=Polaribacter marinus TaxID=2916838 RepID=A0A9X2AKN7_9FLAO|nr:hypothetical protein [Polaribacter marinus]MCI2228435.1 hypothetical protein [Polaribacter marinus]